MKRTWPIIGVRDVRRSFEWYQWSPGNGVPGNGLLLFFRVDDFAEALQRARTLVARLEQEPEVSPSTGTPEFALRDPDGYYVMISALDA